VRDLDLLQCTIQDEYKFIKNTSTGGFMCIRAAYQEVHSVSSLGPDSNESSPATASRSHQVRMAGTEAVAVTAPVVVVVVAGGGVARRQLGHVESWVSLSKILSANR
jgi:hypothetical protein